MLNVLWWKRMSPVKFLLPYVLQCTWYRFIFKVGSTWNITKSDNVWWTFITWEFYYLYWSGWKWRTPLKAKFLSRLLTVKQRRQNFKKTILTLFEDIRFPCNFHKILADFSKNCPDNLRFNRKVLKNFSHKIYGKSFLPKLFGKFFVDFQFHLESFKIDKNTQEKFLNEISTKFKMSRFMKMLLVDSLIFIMTSNKEMLVVSGNLR